MDANKSLFKYCPNCKGGFKKFQKILDLKEIRIFCYRKQNDKAGDTEHDVSYEDIFILHNTRNNELSTTDFVRGFESSEIKCARCREMASKAQKLIGKSDSIMRKGIKSICNYCIANQLHQSCANCEDVAKKFATSEYAVQDEYSFKNVSDDSIDVMFKKTRGIYRERESKLEEITFSPPVTLPTQRFILKPLFSTDDFKSEQDSINENLSLDDLLICRQQMIDSRSISDYYIETSGRFIIGSDSSDLSEQSQHTYRLLQRIRKMKHDDVKNFMNSIIKALIREDTKQGNTLSTKKPGKQRSPIPIEKSNKEFEDVIVQAIMTDVTEGNKLTMHMLELIDAQDKCNDFVKKIKFKLQKDIMNVGKQMDTDEIKNTLETMDKEEENGEFSRSLVLSSIIRKKMEAKKNYLINKTEKRLAKFMKTESNLSIVSDFIQAIDTPKIFDKKITKKIESIILKKIEREKLNFSTESKGVEVKINSKSEDTVPSAFESSEKFTFEKALRDGARLKSKADDIANIIRKIPATQKIIHTKQVYQDIALLIKSKMEKRESKDLTEEVETEQVSKEKKLQNKIDHIERKEEEEKGKAEKLKESLPSKSTSKLKQNKTADWKKDFTTQVGAKPIAQKEEKPQLEQDEMLGRTKKTKTEVEIMDKPRLPSSRKIQKVMSKNTNKPTTITEKKSIESTKAGKLDAVLKRGTELEQAEKKDPKDIKEPMKLTEKVNIELTEEEKNATALKRRRELEQAGGKDPKDTKAPMTIPEKDNIELTEEETLAAAVKRRTALEQAGGKDAKNIKEPTAIIDTKNIELTKEDKFSAALKIRPEPEQAGGKDTKDIKKPTAIIEKKNIELTEEEKIATALKRKTDLEHAADKDPKNIKNPKAITEKKNVELTKEVNLKRMELEQAGDNALKDTKEPKAITEKKSIELTKQEKIATVVKRTTELKHAVDKNQEDKKKSTALTENKNIELSEEENFVASLNRKTELKQAGGKDPKDIKELMALTEKVNIELTEEEKIAAAVKRWTELEKAGGNDPKNIKEPTAIIEKKNIELTKEEKFAAVLRRTPEIEKAGGKHPKYIKDSTAIIEKKKNMKLTKEERFAAAVKKRPELEQAGDKDTKDIKEPTAITEKNNIELSKQQKIAAALKRRTELGQTGDKNLKDTKEPMAKTEKENIELTDEEMFATALKRRKELVEASDKDPKTIKKPTTKTEKQNIESTEKEKFAAALTRKTKLEQAGDKDPKDIKNTTAITDEKNIELTKQDKLVAALKRKTELEQAEDKALKDIKESMAITKKVNKELTEEEKFTAASKRRTELEQAGDKDPKNIKKPSEITEKQNVESTKEVNFSAALKRRLELEQAGSKDPKDIKKPTAITEKKYFELTKQEKFTTALKRKTELQQAEDKVPKDIKEPIAITKKVNMELTEEEKFTAASKRRTELEQAGDKDPNNIKKPTAITEKQNVESTKEVNFSAALKRRLELEQAGGKDPKDIKTPTAITEKKNIELTQQEKLAVALQRKTELEQAEDKDLKDIKEPMAITEKVNMEFTEAEKFTATLKRRTEVEQTGDKDPKKTKKPTAITEKENIESAKEVNLKRMELEQAGDNALKDTKEPKAITEKKNVELAEEEKFATALKTELVHAEGKDPKDIKKPTAITVKKNIELTKEDLFVASLIRRMELEQAGDNAPKETKEPMAITEKKNSKLTEEETFAAALKRSMEREEFDLFNESKEGAADKIGATEKNELILTIYRGETQIKKRRDETKQDVEEIKKKKEHEPKIKEREHKTKENETGTETGTEIESDRDETKIKKRRTQTKKDVEESKKNIEHEPKIKEKERKMNKKESGTVTESDRSETKINNRRGQIKKDVEESKKKKEHEPKIKERDQKTNEKETGTEMEREKGKHLEYKNTMADQVNKLLQQQEQKGAQALKLAEQANKETDTMRKRAEQLTHDQDSKMRIKLPEIKRPTPVAKKALSVHAVKPKEKNVNIPMKLISLKAPSDHSSLTNLVKIHHKPNSKMEPGKNALRNTQLQSEIIKRTKEKRKAKEDFISEVTLTSTKSLNVVRSSEHLEELRTEPDEKIIGSKIVCPSKSDLVKQSDKKKEPKPILFHTTFNTRLPKLSTLNLKTKTEKSYKLPSQTEVKTRMVNKGKGISQYALSDTTNIDNGYTKLPVEKIFRKMNVYRMHPVYPKFDWFENNKDKKFMQYDTGELLADISKDGCTRWYYRNGGVALEYYDAKNSQAQQRMVIYSTSKLNQWVRPPPVTILAAFDYSGNGMIFDENGRVRLQYNQTEGIVLDEKIGPKTHWQWHDLNDPPNYKNMIVETREKQKDPILEEPDYPRSAPDEYMRAIELDNLVKDRSGKTKQKALKYKPFPITTKAVRLNDFFSVKILDQTKVYITYRDGSTYMKVNLGMILDPNEIMETECVELKQAVCHLDRYPAMTESIDNLQQILEAARKRERKRLWLKQKLCPAEPGADEDRRRATLSLPLNLPPYPLNPLNTYTTSQCPCDCNK